MIHLLSLLHPRGVALTIRWQRDSRSPGPGAAYTPRQQHRPFGERRSISDSQSLGVDVSGSDSRSRTLQPARPGVEHLDHAQIVSVCSGTARSSVFGNGVLHPAAGDDTQDTQETENHDWRRANLDVPCAERPHRLSCSVSGIRWETGHDVLPPKPAKRSVGFARRP